MAQIKNITPFVTSFERSGAFPLDKLSYFDTYAEAQALALTAVEAGTDGNTTAYFGQIFVVAEEGGNFGAYQVQRDGSLKKFGQASSAEEIAGKVAELEKTVKQHTTDIGNKLDKTATVNGKGFVDNAVSIGTDDIAVGESTLTAALAANDTAHGTFTSGIAANKKAIDDYKVANDQALGEVSTSLNEYKAANDIKVNKNTTDIGTINESITDINSKLGKDQAGNVIDSTYATIASLDAYKTDNDAKVNKNASDITDLKEKVTGGMHYKGKFDALPAVDTYAAGDFVIVGTKEYILFESAEGVKSWDELGDEGSHLTKAQADGYYDPKGKAQELIEALDVAAVNVAAGETIKSIGEVDGKIAVEKQAIAIEQSAVNGLDTALNGKQDKITAENKLDASLIANLPEGHNQTVKVGEVVFGADDVVNVAAGSNIAVSASAETKTITISGAYGNASTENAGLMSAADKTLLGSLNDNVGASTDEASATGSLFARIAQNKADIAKNTAAISNLTTQMAGTIKEVQVNGTKIEPTDGAVNIALGGLATKDKVSEADVDATFLSKITNYVSSVEETEFTVTEGKLAAKALSTDKLIQGAEEFILNGGTAAA